MVSDDAVATIYADSASAATDGVDTTIYRATVNIPNPVVVAGVEYKRANKRDNKSIDKQTVVFPFDIPSTCLENGSLYTLGTIKQNNNGSWAITAVMDNSSIIKANSPRILLSSSGVVSFKTGSGCSYTLQTGAFNVDSIQATGFTGKWYLGGTYELKTGLDKKNIFGFASKAKTVQYTNKAGDIRDTSVALSQFVKAGSKASVPPLRAFLQYSTSGFTAKAAAGVISSIGAEELPSTIDVIFEDEDGNTLSIAQLNTRTGEIVADKDAWFDLKGRKLNKKPTVKGTYYNNGQKVIIK
ncbi:hypothetical protein BGX12_10743 [Fibrobacter sp. UWR4]|nr:hypothetical protein BGX12_10743 [Fibrobacter sp. UWR4]PZW72091.1 hypothetical protein C8E88_100863 [Fibrobacter sp. UWR1]